MSYLNQPPTQRPSVTADNLAAVPAVGAADHVGTGALNVPDAGTPGHNRMQYDRRQFGVGLTIPPQSVGMGAESKQSGSGRAHIPATLALPEQSPTPIPDGRRIARPMPTAAFDDGQAING